MIDNQLGHTDITARPNYKKGNQHHAKQTRWSILWFFVTWRIFFAIQFQPGCDLEYVKSVHEQILFTLLE
jgi:hypothetical protein